MPYAKIVALGGDTGRISVNLYEEEILFSDIIQGIPQIFEGSQFCVRERFSLFTSIEEPSWVSADFGWYNKRRFIGTYQILDGVPSTAREAEGEGFIYDEGIRVSRESYYTVTANPEVPIARKNFVDINNCNFYLTPSVRIFPESPIPIPGYEVYGRSPSFTGVMSLSAATLKDVAFSPKIPAVGLFLNPGVIGVSLIYEISVVGEIAVDLPAMEPTSCVFGEVADCNTLYEQFTTTGQNFASQGECEAATGQACFPFVWTCPTDESDERTIWHTS